MNETGIQMLEGMDAVIFDMDGTLIDSMWIWPSVDRDFLKKYHLEMAGGMEEAVEGMSFTETAAHFLETYPELDMTVEEMQKEWLDMIFEKYTTEVSLKEGAYDFIISLKKQGYKFGIATSNTRVLVDATLEVLGITELFDSICTSCEAKAGKPAPDVYLMVAENMEVEPSKCLVFEDVPMGILGGKNAGMKVCAVDDEYSRPQEAKKKELADYYIWNYNNIKNNTYEVLK